MGNSTLLPRWNKKKLRHLRRRLFTRVAGKFLVTYKIDHVTIEGRSGAFYQLSILVNLRVSDFLGVIDYSQLLVDRGGSFPWNTDEGIMIQTVERAIRTTDMLTKEVTNVCRFYLDMKPHQFKVITIRHVPLRELTN